MTVHDEFNLRDLARDLEVPLRDVRAVAQRLLEAIYRMGPEGSWSWYQKEFPDEPEDDGTIDGRP